MAVSEGPGGKKNWKAPVFLDPSKEHAASFPLGQAVPGEYMPHVESAPDSEAAPSVRGGQQEGLAPKLSPVHCWFSHTSWLLAAKPVVQEAGWAHAVVSGPSVFVKAGMVVDMIGESIVHGSELAGDRIYVSSHAGSHIEGLNIEAFFTVSW